jgi:PIN domain nuclease of toxin-antitoxin system
LRLLLDTHVLLWALIEPKRLSAEFQALLENPDHEVLFSAASIWEMSIKAALGRADFQVSPATIVEAAQATGFIELPVHAAAALKVAALPHHHRDPFDRLLVAQAMTEPAALYTADAQLRAYSELVVRI